MGTMGHEVHGEADSATVSTPISTHWHDVGDGLIKWIKEAKY